MINVCLIKKYVLMKIVKVPIKSFSKIAILKEQLFLLQNHYNLAAFIFFGKQRNGEIQCFCWHPCNPP